MTQIPRANYHPNFSRYWMFCIFISRIVTKAEYFGADSTIDGYKKIDAVYVGFGVFILQHWKFTMIGLSQIWLSSMATGMTPACGSFFDTYWPQFYQWFLLLNAVECCLEVCTRRNFIWWTAHTYTSQCYWSGTFPSRGIYLMVCSFNPLVTFVLVINSWAPHNRFPSLSKKKLRFSVTIPLQI